MIVGSGTLVNVATVLLGCGVGVLLGNRLPVRTRDLVTDGLGLVTLLIAATSAMAVLSPDLADEVGGSAPMLIVLGAVLVGGITGSLLGLEQGVERLGGWLQRRLVGTRRFELPGGHGTPAVQEGEPRRHVFRTGVWDGHHISFHSRWTDHLRPLCSALVSLCRGMEPGRG